MSKSIVKVDTYNPLKAVRVSNDFFDVSKCILEMGSLHAIKLLYALAQSVQGRDVITFPTIDFSIDAAFDYLGIKGSNKRFMYLRNALDNVLRSGISIVRSIGENTTYTGLSWISFYEFSTDKSRVVITLNPAAERYLLQLSQFAIIRPQMYMKLTTSYQAWLYPYLVNRRNVGKWVESIEDLKTMLCLQDKATYSHSMLGTNRFLSRVLGITISDEYKKELAQARAQKRKTQFIPWDYTKDKDGRAVGTLYNINTNTDISVLVSPLKTGRTYTHVVFRFGEENMTDDKEGSNPSTMYEDLFDSQFSSTVSHKQVPVEQEYTEEEARKMWEETYSADVTFERFLELGHFTQRDEKYYRTIRWI